MPIKPSEEEEKFFQAENARKISQLKDEKMANTQKNERAMEVARAVGSEDAAIGERLISLGFDAEKARILFFIPLIEVAWADGKIGYEESYKLVDQARTRGIRATSGAYDFLSSLTLKRPSTEFFDGCNSVIRELLGSMSSEKREQETLTLTDLCAQIARASRGFFGFGAEVSVEERQAIQEIVAELGIENSAKAKELLKKL